MTDETKALAEKLRKFAWPLLVLLLGVFLLLLPTGAKEKTPEPSAASALAETLREAEGVGRVRVLVSEKGAVVVCDGAENAAVRLNILRAIGSYTGFGSDRITVLKMTD